MSLSRLIATDSVVPVHSFDSVGDDNALPAGGLVRGPDTNLYGVSAPGALIGTNIGGTVYRMTPKGVVTTLHKFDRAFGANVGGAKPVGELHLHKNGYFYGVTQAGGESGCGTIFRLSPDGSQFQTLVNFTGLKTGPNRGATPVAGLIADKDGENLYGTTNVGGANGNGTIFKLTPAGALTTLFDLAYNALPNKGSNPSAPLTLGSDGAIWGTTSHGGANGQGTVFRFTDGALPTLTTVAEFPAAQQVQKGAYPWGGLLSTRDGMLWGVTWKGGAGGTGTIFTINPTDRLFTTVGSFDPVDGVTKSNATGANPTVSLIETSSGAIYGTTSAGGAENMGTIFRLNGEGTLSLVYSFQFDGKTGVYPNFRLVEARDGLIYGAANSGESGGGVIFKLAGATAPPLSTGLVWGQRVAVTSATDTFEDFLVACDGTALVFASDLRFVSGKLVVNGALRTLSSILTLRVLSDPGWKSRPNYATYGFNKYCTTKYSGGMELAASTSARTEVTCYAAGNWTLIGSDGTAVTVASKDVQLYAIPRAPAPDGWLRIAQRTSELDQPLRSQIDGIAYSFGIPPQTLYGKFWVESAKPGKVGWNQYGFVSMRPRAPGTAGAGVPVYRDDPADGAKTLVTYDGGIGMGQLTGSTALTTVPAASGDSLTARLSHLYALASDTRYNLVTAAALLVDKRAHSMTRGKKIGTGTAAITEAAVLEHWYNGLWEYNGIPNGTAKFSSQLPVYPTRVFTKMQEGGLRRWTFWKPPALGLYFAPSPSKRGYGIDQAAPTLGTDAATKTAAAHLDTDFDGQVDAAVWIAADARTTKARAGGTFTLNTKTDPARPTVKISAVQVSFTEGAMAGGDSTALNLASTDGVVFTGALPAKVVGSATPYVATIAVTLQGTSPGSNQATGITYRFTLPE